MAFKTKNFTVIDGMQGFVQMLDASITEPELIINYIGEEIKAKVGRSGYHKWLDNPDSEPVYGHEAITIKDATNGDKSYILRFSGKHIYSFEIGSAATSWGSPVFTFTNDPGGIRPKKYRNALFIASALGNNPLYYAHHDSSGDLEILEETADEAPVNPSVLEVYANALFCNDSSVPYRLRRSAVGYGTSATIGAPVTPFDGNQWKQNDNDPATARFYDVNPDTNGLLVGLKMVNNKLRVFMGSDVGDMGMFSFDFDSLLQVPTSVSIRPNGQETITISEDGACYFANNSGVYVYDGSRPKRISLALGKIGEDISPAVAVDFRQRYMVALSNDLTWNDHQVNTVYIPNPILVKDQISDEWVLFSTAHKMTSFDTIALGTDEPIQLYSGDNEGNSYIWSDSDTTDDGKTIFCRLQFRPFFGNTIAKELSLRELYVVADPYSNQEIQLCRFENKIWGKKTTLSGDITKIPLDDLSHTHGFGTLVTSQSSESRPRFYGHIIVYNDEGADDGR